MMLQMIEYDYSLKMCIFCYPDELLTHSLRSSAHEVFERDTMGFNTPTLSFELNSDFLKLILMEISTDPSFLPTNRGYYGGTSAAIFAFSKTDYSYYKSAIDHYHDFRKVIPQCPVVVLGLFGESEVVTQAEGESLAQELGVDYVEMTASDLQALETVLKSLSRKVIVLQTS